MKINQSNYEIFFLDYLDGKLSDDQVDEFLDFLKANPALRDELESVKEIELSGGDLTFPWKNELIKEEEGHSFEYRAIAFMEGNLSGEDQKSFIEELDSDPKKEQEFDLILSTKLKKEEVVYAYKDELYRKSKVKLLYRAVRVAAILILFIAIWSVLTRENAEVTEPPMLSESITPSVTLDKNELEQKQERIAKKKPVEKINEAKTDSIPKKKKSIRERTKGRLKEVAKNDQVSRISAPEPIAPLLASLEMSSDINTFTLDEMKVKSIPHKPDYISLDKYLAQKIFKGTKNKSEENFAQKSLKAVSGWSNEKLAYETDDQGKVSEISVNTGLLAFSIPLSKNK